MLITQCCILGDQLGFWAGAKMGLSDLAYKNAGCPVKEDVI